MSIYLLAVFAREGFVFIVHSTGMSRQLVPLLEALLAELAGEGLVIVMNSHHMNT